MLVIEIFGKPIPWKRPAGRYKRYDEQKKLKEGIQWQMKSQIAIDPITTPIQVKFLFFFRVPKYTSSIKRQQMLNGIIPHTCKPDLSNLIKFYEDAGNGILWEDDRQIYRYLDPSKMYGEDEKTVIMISSPSILSPSPLNNS